METQNLLITLFCCCFFLLTGVESSAEHHHHDQHHHRHRHRRHSEFDGKLAPKKLFVFGDSYADTGNNRISLGSSWKVPYGTTFPGKPCGRFSDGRVFTDFLARYLELKSPVPYRWRKYTPNNLKYGMNFAFGGTGVFDTLAPYPNLTTQIDLFQRLVYNDSIFTTWDLQNSIVLVSLAGNDYSAFLSRGGSTEDLQGFIPKVVNQLALDLQRIYNLGVKKIAVTALQPLGCLPRSTVTTGFQQCNSTDNKAVSFHNLLLQQAIAFLNNQTRDDHGSPFIVLDLYNSFLSIFQERGAQLGSLMFESPLKPCCMGINQNYSCGSVDSMGNKMYTVCEDPKSSFFWDSVHPTQAGWNSVYLALHATLLGLRYS